jgi:hypothetical protein
VELSVEAVVEQNRIEVEPPVPQTSAVNEALRKVEAYIRAWRLPDEMAQEVVTSSVVRAAALLTNDGSADPTRTAIAEAEKVLRERLNKMLGGALGEDANEISVEERAALLWARLPDLWARDANDAAALAAAYSKGLSAMKLAQQPQRLPQTHPMVMQTSLTRLPSFRIVAGWFALVVLIILAFIFTR